MSLKVLKKWRSKGFPHRTDMMAHYAVLRIYIFDDNGDSCSAWALDGTHVTRGSKEHCKRELDTFIQGQGYYLL